MWHAKNLPLSSRQAHKLVTSLSLPSWISSWATLEKGDSANQPTSKLQNTERKILHLGTNWLENKTAQPHLERDKYGLENRKSDLSPPCECSFRFVEFIFCASRTFIERLSLTMIERVTSMINWMIYCLDWPLRNPIWGLAWIQIIVIR